MAIPTGCAQERKAEETGSRGAKAPRREPTVDAEWAALDETHEDSVQDAAPGNRNHGFGGGEINEVHPWCVQVQRAQGARDMRPTKTTRPNTLTTTNRYVQLQNDDEEHDDVDDVAIRRSSTSSSRIQQQTAAVSRAPRWVTIDRGLSVDSVDVNRPKKIWSVTTVPGQWEQVPFKIGTGASDTVMPSTVAYYEISATEISETGPGFRSENRAPIKHYGQRTLQEIGDYYQPLSMTAQVTDTEGWKSGALRGWLLLHRTRMHGTQNDT